MTGFQAVRGNFFGRRQTSFSPVASFVSIAQRSWSIEGFALSLYLIRDAFAGAIRYYFNVLRIDSLWFVPDIFAIACIAVFIRRYIIDGKSTIAIFFVLYVAFALMLGYIFLGTFSGFASSFKMFAPIFVGFCFCERRMVDYPKILSLMKFLFYASVVGALASTQVNFPWVGYSYESFGATRQAGKLWWAQSEQRLAGFAADSTMAGFFILITFVFTATRSKLWWILLWGGIGLYAIKVTTSKTSLGVMAIFFVAIIIVRIFPENLRFKVVRTLGVYSFLAILIPIFFVTIFSGLDLTSISPTLFSMEDRINNSWQKPFLYMADLMPIGYVTGCGLGCFNYPQQLFSPETAKYYVAVDNFYLGTYLMFGFPFAIFMIYVIISVRNSSDVFKLTLVFVMNVFTVTILSYGPASGLIMTAFAFSDVFARPTLKSLVTQSAGRLSWRARMAPRLRPAE